MRIAHLIMAHKNPAQLQRLIKRLAHVNVDIYVHLDGKIPIDHFQNLESDQEIIWIRDRIKCNWGGFSFVRAIFNSMKEILENRKEYSFINLLSAQDYPIIDSDHLYQFFAEHIGINFISYEFEENSEWWKNATGRYEKYHLTDSNFKGKYLVENILNKLAPPRAIPGNLTLFGSSNSSWWTITSECAEYIIGQFDNNFTLRKFLKYCWGTDEFVIATLIMNSPFKENVINNNLRYIDWSEGNAHPKLIVSADLKKVLDSKMLFARKFDIEKDVKILDALDANVSTYLNINPIS